MVVKGGRRSLEDQEEPGATRRTRRMRRNQEKPEGTRRSQDAPGVARRSQVILFIPWD